MTKYKALSPIEAIRSRPGMYIGDTVNPNQLITEALDNALDEVANGYANKCQIHFDLENNICWISDNGRGIKSYQMKDSNGKLENSIYLLCTATHSGSKFDNDDYGTLIGMHGVGLVVINALSNWFVVKTRNRKNKKLVYEYNFLNGELHSNNSYEDLEGINDWSTLIGFEPNIDYFENGKFKIKEFANRLMLAQAKFPTCTFSFNEKPITKRSFEEYVQTVLDIDNDEYMKYIHYNKKQNKKIEIYYTFKKNQDINIFGDVNLRHCDGTYLTNIQTILKNLILTKLGKKFENISPNLLLMGLNLYASVTVPEPKFDSQSKTRMTLDIKNDLIYPIQDKIKRSLDSGTLEIIKQNLEHRLNKKFVQTVTNNNKRISAKNKLCDCAKSPGKILYIVEGDSALGPLKQIRDIKTEAIFPLRGKMINVETASIDKIKDNKEISDLLEALGPKNKRRYETIKVLADADSVSAESMIHYVDKHGFIQRNQIQNMYGNFEEGYIESLNKETGDCELKKINRVIAHNYDKDYLFRITTIGKHYEDFTDDHVIYVWDNKNYQVKETSPSKIDMTTDLIIIPKKRFTLNKKIEVFENCELNVHNSNEYGNGLIDISDDFDAIKIRSIKKVPYKYDKVYDLEVEDNNNFPVGELGFIVHNSDGHHIAVLVLLSLLKFADDIIKNNNVRIILPPLYGASKGKKFYPIYNHNELGNYNGYEITRFKGLGEMSPKKLKASIDAGVEYIVEYPESKKQLDSILNIITNTEMKRLLLKRIEFNFEKLLEKAKS